MKIDLSIIKILYSYGEDVYCNNISLSQATDELIEKGINENSAVYYLKAYKFLVEGKVFTRTISDLAIEYYLDSLIKKNGVEVLRNVLQSICLHIIYYEGVSGKRKVGLRKILDKYSKKGVVLFGKTFEEEYSSEPQLFEGTQLRVNVNVYERNKIARHKCIDHYGLECAICGFNFETVYGELGRGFIHVHHVVDIAEVGGKYKIDYVEDLIPVCPNCHAMLHKKKPAYKISELKNLLKIVE